MENRDQQKRRPRRQPISSDGFLTRPPAKQAHYYLRSDSDERAATVVPQRGSAAPQKRVDESSVAARSAAAPPASAQRQSDSVDERLRRAFAGFRLQVPGEGSQPRTRPNYRRKSAAMTRQWAVRITAAILIIGFGMGGWLFGQGYLRVHKAFSGGSNVAALQKNVDPNLLKGEGDGRINILLLGNGGDGHEAPDLTDTLILASIDPVNHTASLVSVPRDLWIQLPGRGSMKINAAYETGKYAYLHRIDSSNADQGAIQAGFATADQAVEQVLGVGINYNVLVNFISFRQGVDAVNGVTVNVPQTLYDPTMAWENHWNPTLATQGIQTFSGDQALLYVRSRETSSDFARSERQRAVLTALKDKIVTLGTLSNPIKIAKLMSAFGDNVKTDLSISNAARLYDLTKNIGDGQIQSVGLADASNHLVTTGRQGNQSVVLPTAGLNNYTPIQEFIRRQLPDGYIVKEHAKILVLNASGQKDLEAEKASELTSYGYNVIGQGLAPDGYAGGTALYSVAGSSYPYTRHYLETRLGVKAQQHLPPAVQTDGADFIIIYTNR